MFQVLLATGRTPHGWWDPEPNSGMFNAVLASHWQVTTAKSDHLLPGIFPASAWVALMIVPTWVAAGGFGWRVCRCLV